MKSVFIDKAAGSGEITDAQLEAVNRYTRRVLEKDEVFIFSLVLCDNEIDRDFERFPRESVEKLAELYKGKTGVFDHSPKAENQSARIFDTEVIAEDSENSLGEPYCCLKAWAYMARCEESRGLITEIDAGIKKEVSVGCAVEKTICSVCGADIKASSCGHTKAGIYDGRPCHHLLINPTDAYEWSFVAVPAQKRAGVTKNMSGGFSLPEHIADGMTLEKLFTQDPPDDGVIISKSRFGGLEREYKAILALAKAGEEYVEGMRREAVKLLLLTQPELPPGLAGEVAEKMDIARLKDFNSALRKSAAKVVPIAPQLAGPLGNGDSFEAEHGRFKI